MTFIPSLSTKEYRAPVAATAPPPTRHTATCQPDQPLGGEECGFGGHYS